jgi:hypothetical protein
VRDRKVIKYGSLEEGEQVITSNEKDVDTNSKKNRLLLLMSTGGQRKLKARKKTKRANKNMRTRTTKI